MASNWLPRTMDGLTNTDNYCSSSVRKIDQDSMDTNAVDNDLNFSSADVARLQQENAELKKEMQAMESKLKSNMKSIKTFWSPELKKEKAAKIEQGDRYLSLREKYSKLSDEAQVFQTFLFL